MNRENNEKKDIGKATSDIFTQETVEGGDIGASELEDNLSAFEEVTEVDPGEEGIEISQPSSETVEPTDSSAEEASDDGYVAETDQDSTSEPPGHIKSTLTKISWPDPEHFHSDESILLVDNPSIFKSLDKYIAGSLIALIGVFLSGHYLTGATNVYLQNELPFGITLYATRNYLYSLLLVTGVGVAIVLWAHIQRLHTWYFVTDQRSWVRAGVLSQRDHGSLDHTKVNNVEEENPFPMNRWDVGHIRLFTAASDGSELEFSHLKNPTVWKSRVRDSMMMRKEDNQSLNDDIK